jgi:hypothetical protein
VPPISDDPGQATSWGRREPAGHAHVQQGVDAEEAQAVQLGAPAVPATASSPSKPKVDSAKKKLDPFLHVDVPDVTEQSQPYHSADPDRHRLTLLNAWVNRDRHRAVRTVAYVNEDFTVAYSEADVVSVNVLPVEMVEGAAIATAVLRKKPPQQPPPGYQGTGWRLAQIATYTDHVEKIEAPPTDDYVPATQADELARQRGRATARRIASGGLLTHDAVDS